MVGKYKTETEIKDMNLVNDNLGLEHGGCMDDTSIILPSYVFISI
jgi:hypothetical protein